MKSKLFFLIFISITAVLPALSQKPVISTIDSINIRTFFFSGLTDKLNENYEKATENFKKILLIDSNHVASHYELAVILFRQNKLMDAELHIKRATAIDGENIWYWKLLAELYKRNGNMMSLVRVFNEMIRLSPDNEDYYYDRSNAWLLSGKVDEAMKGYEELEKKFGLSEALIQARKRINEGNKEKASNGNVTEQQATVQDPNDPKVIALQAQDLYKKGDLKGALEKFKQVLNVTDQIYSVWEQAIDIQMNLELYGEVIGMAEQALSVFPNQAILYYYLAYALQQTEKYDEALANVKMAVQLDVENMIYQECLGDLLALKGNIDQAVVQWKAAKAGGNNSKKLKEKIDAKKYIK